MNCAFSIPHIDDYPADLDDAERDRIKAAEIRAARVVALKKSSVRSEAEKETLLLRDWVLPIFAAFSNLAFNRAKGGTWPIHKADSESREFVKVLAASAGMNSPDAWMAGGGRIIRSEIQNEIEGSPQWKRHQEKLLELADAPDNTAAPTSADIKALKGGEPEKESEALRRTEEASSRQPDPALLTPIPSQATAEGEITDLPELSESAKRKLAIKWSDLLAGARLTGEHLEWHAKAPKFGHVKVMIGDVDTGQRLSIPVKVDRIGVDPSVSVAKVRFGNLAHEYWSAWHASGTGWETCKIWLDGLRQQVLRELASLWEGRSDAMDRWYERICRPAIEKTLTECVDEKVEEARAVELQRLECGSSKPAASTDNAILKGPSQGQAPKVAKGADTGGATLIGNNINRLRKECGWSFDELADKTGLEKKLILGHVNEGKGAYPRTLRTYADAFTKALSRKVTVEEIESQHAKSHQNNPEKPPSYH
jgi:hypothetical protein